MIEVIEFTDEYKTAWSNYVNNSPFSTIAHESGWKDVMKYGLGHTPRYLMAVEGSKVKGILPLCIVKTWWGKRYIVSLPWIDYGGVCADNIEIEQAILDKARSITRAEKADFLELRSVDADETDLAVKSDKYTFILKLDKNPDEIWKGFDSKLRNQIRKSQKSDLRTELGGIEKLPSFYRVFCRNMRDLGTPVWGYNFFRQILEQFPDSSRILLVIKDNTTIGGGVVLSFKDRLYVPSASSYREYLKYCPNHALYWRVIQEGCNQSFGYFDFGRSKYDSNTFRFKKQWVPDPKQLHWQYFLNRISEVPSINPDNPKYRLFIGLWQRLPLRVANFLGPKIIKNFP